MLTRSKSVTDILRTKLLEGELLPGDHLQEVPLAELMGVSRTPVRAALAALEREGLLSYVAKRGFEVRRFSSEEIADKFLVRSVLEGNAAGECARLGLSSDELAALERCLREGDRILARGALDPADLPDYRDMNNTFHGTIVEGSQSPTTAAYVAQISQIPFLSDRIILWHDFKLIDRSHDDHHRLYDAIRGRNALRAESLMREHVFYMGQVVQKFLGPTSPGALNATTASMRTHD